MNVDCTYNLHQLNLFTICCYKHQNIKIRIKNLFSCLNILFIKNQITTNSNILNLETILELIKYIT